MNEAYAYEIMRLVMDAAQGSPDPSTQNAAVIVNPWRGVAPETLAVNRFPTGVQENPERWERPGKYLFVEHAERNAIYAAARHGIATKNMMLVAVWAACADCARAIIQAEISTLVRYVSTEHLHWSDSTNAAEKMLEEAGVEIVTLDRPMPDVAPLRRNENVWLPSGATPIC